MNMRAPRVAVVVSQTATVPLRFDDPDFVTALVRDGDTPGGVGPLAQLLEVRKAADVDFSPFVDDGYVIHARPLIKTDERSTMINVGQKAGGGVDVKAAQRNLWASWVTRVTVDEDLALSDQMRTSFAGLCHRQPKTREDAFGELPSTTADRLMARLRVHIEAAGRPADRDPAKVTPGEAETPLLDTGSSSNGDLFLSSGADQ